jgi:hypothetical protein
VCGGLQHPLAAAHDRKEGGELLAAHFFVPTTGQRTGPVLVGEGLGAAPSGTQDPLIAPPPSMLGSSGERSRVWFCLN